MSKNKTAYNIINILMIIAAILLFAYEYTDIASILCGNTWAYWLILTLTVVLVHIIKAGRLYLALYGSNVNFGEYIKTYCRVTPVSIIFPFKTGEFLRMYCYGELIGDVLKGIVIILLDRFMDTAALITAILLIWILKGGNITSVVYVLLIFLVFVLLVYSVYPGVYKFWKKYLLKNKASEHKLSALKVLETVHVIYHEIENVVRGRGMILGFLSLAAWGVEVGSLALLYTQADSSGLSKMISKYLTSAMGSGQCEELKRFVLLSVMLLVMIYLLIKASEVLIRKKVQE